MANPIPGAGLGSNLDVQGLVDRLMTVEKQPLDKLNTKEAAVQLKISAFGTFRGAVSSFSASLAGLENTSIYTSNKATVDDSDVASASATAAADLGTHTLEVTNLAVAQRLKSNTAFTNLTDTVGTGKLTIEFGSYDANNNNAFTVNAKKPSQAVTIDAAHNTLAGVRDAINAAKIGVSASIVNDGTGNRLVITSKDSGTTNSLRITAADDDNDPTDAAGLSQLAYDPSAAGGAGVLNMTQVIAAEDAKFNLDGLTITKSSNVVTDVLAGTTLTLKKENTGSPTELTISQDTSGVKSAVDAFVKAYNDLDTTTDQLTNYDAASKTAATLQGDVTVRSLVGQIRDAVGAVTSGVPGGYNALAQIGITVDRNGQMSVNATKLQNALQTNPTGVRSLFATTGSSSDSLVSYVRAGSSTPAGSYGLKLTQIATQGNAVGSAAAMLNINSSNHQLTVEVNGTSTTVTLADGVYADADAVATELQSKLNGSTALVNAGLTVNVTQSSGVLTLTSNSYGSASKIRLVGDPAQSALFGPPTFNDGLDVAGTLGGVEGFGSGQTFTGVNGLVLSVAGGGTGDRGNISFSRGIAVALDNLLSKALGTKGTLSSATDALQASVKDIDAQRDKLNAQLEVKEQRYKDQFNTLDGLITSMQSTMTYLAQQLASLNSSTK